MLWNPGIFQSSHEHMTVNHPPFNFQVVVCAEELGCRAGRLHIEHSAFQRAFQITCPWGKYKSHSIPHFWRGLTGFHTMEYETAFTCIYDKYIIEYIGN